MEQFVEVTPSHLAGVIGPDGMKHVSPEAQDILDRLKGHYQSLGKPSAATNYGRHLKSFFSWAEKQGYSVRTLPPDAVEGFLSALQSVGQKESTLYVMRTQLKSALRECHNALGVDFAHLEYQTGKPREVRKAQKEREKAKRAEKRVAMTMAQAAAIEAARASGMPVIPPPYTPPVSPYVESIAGVVDPTELPMSTQNSPETTGATAVGAAPVAPQQPVVVVQMPPQTNQRPTSTIGAQKPAGNQSSTSTVGRGMTINTHTFSGPYVRISRMADGTDPLTPPGTETYITTVPLTQLLPHGDVAAYLQSFVIPNLRLPPVVSQVHFVFNELNDRRQPTGRRDELVVSLPLGNSLGAASMAGGPSSTNVGNNVNGLNVGYNGLNGLPSGGNDRATDYLLRKLDEEATQARKRAEELQEKMRSEKDAQTTFLLMQQFQKEQDLRRELEERKARELEKSREPPPAPMFPPHMFMPPPPPPPPEPPRIDSSTEMVKTLADNQTKMMEAMMTGMRQPPPPPQKDSMEVMLPFISAMNQQMMQQQQQNQAMMLQIQQQNQQFMQALLTRENPVEKMLLMQLQEVKAEARAPKGDEMEEFANKLQKMKMVSDMLGGGGSAPSLIGELLANAEAIGEGAAKIIAASKSKVVLPNQPSAIAGAPTAGAPQALPAGTPPPVPDVVTQKLNELEAAAAKGDDQEIVTAVVDLVRGFVESPEPFNRIGQRLLNAFKDMEEQEELFVFSKTLYTVVNRKPSKETVRVVADTLAKWYSVIHEQVFGTPKALGGEVEVDETDENGETDEAQDDGITDAEISEPAGA
jgi:hypothetical protein